MTTATLDHPPMLRTQPVPPPAVHGVAGHRSVRKASIAAGVGLLAMSALSGFGYLVAAKGLVTQGNAAQTASDIMSHEGLFRLGIVSLFLVATLDVVVAWALYRVFSSVSTGVSKLGAWLRTAYAGIFLVAISQLVGVLHVLSTDPMHGEVLRRINAFTDIWDAGLVLFGIHLLVIVYLAFQSDYVPRLLGVLLAIAGAGYLFDSFSAALSHGSSTPVSSFTFIGEFLLALWLVTFGRRITFSESANLDRPIVGAR